LSLSDTKLVPQRRGQARRYRRLRSGLAQRYRHAAQRLIEIFDWLKRQFPAPLGIWVEGLALTKSKAVTDWCEANRDLVDLVQPRRQSRRLDGRLDGRDKAKDQ